MFKSIVHKLWLTIIVLVLVTIVALGILLSQLFADFYYTQETNALAQHGKQLAELIVLEDNQRFMHRQVELASRFSNSNVMVIDKNGLVCSSSGMMGRTGHLSTMHGMMGQPSRLPPIPIDVESINRVLQGQTMVERGFNRQLGEPALTVAVPILDSNSDVSGAVVLSTPMTPLVETVKAVRKLLIYAAIGATMMATILALFLSRNLSKPLIMMNDVALSMAKGNFEKRMPVKSTDEVGTLARTINYLSEELQQTINDLSQEREQLSRILFSMTDGVITFDQNGKIVMVNPQAENLLKNHTFSSLASGNCCTDFNNFCLPKDMHNLLEQVLAEQDERRAEILINSKVISVRMSPLRDARGKVMGAVALLQDVSKERQLEDMRREFIANVSHELRTPLSYLQGYAEALLDGVIETEDQREKYVRIILEETLRLRRLVDDLLDLSLMEAGQIKLEPTPTSLLQVATKVIDKLQHLAKDKGVEVKLDISDNTPPIAADPNRLEQVLINLVDNGIRHTPPGGSVVIGSKLIQSSDQNNGTLEITVRDTGEGIPAEDLPFIWERFYRVDKARSRSTGSTGLGLAIVKRIVEAHGGTVSATSIPGSGSTFTIKLPAYPQVH